MDKRLVSILLLAFSGIANAGNCPDFYRFIDFGQTSEDGVVYRGGSFFRAENYDGAALLHFELSECVDVGETNTDGHGYAIPVVSSINYDPASTAIELTELRVSKQEDTNTAAEKNAAEHRIRINMKDVNVTRSGNFLCAASSEDDRLSCQLVSPYPGNIALVVYCDQQQCDMPVLAIDERIAVSAKWNSRSGTGKGNEISGEGIVERIEQIYHFLNPLTSVNPG